MTKGKALIEARRILGPSAHVRFEGGLPMPCMVGTFDAHGWRGVAAGKSWGGALAALPKSDAALAWKRQQQIAVTAVRDAKASLSATISRILGRAKGKLTIFDLMRDMRGDKAA